MKISWRSLLFPILSVSLEIEAAKEKLLRSKNKDTEYYMLEIQEAYDIENDLVLDFQINSTIKT